MTTTVTSSGYSNFCNSSSNTAPHDIQGRRNSLAIISSREDKGRRAVPSRSTTRRVLPKRRISPGKRWATGTLCPFTKVPCCDSRSRTTNRPLLWSISQWRRLTHGSRRQISQSGSLPTMAGSRSKAMSEVRINGLEEISTKLMVRRSKTSGAQSKVSDQSGNGDCPADHFGLVHDLDDPRKIGNRLLGKLFLVVAGKTASQVEHASLVAVAGEATNAGVRGVSEPLLSCSGKFSTFHRRRGNHWHQAEGWLCWSHEKRLENATQRTPHVRKWQVAYAARTARALLP